MANQLRDLADLPTASLNPSQVTQISPGIPAEPPDAFLQHQHATWQMFEEQKRLNEALHRENDTLRKELVELRAGIGIKIVIDGLPFSLEQPNKLPELNGHKTRPVNPLTDSFLLE